MTDVLQLLLREKGVKSFAKISSLNDMVHELGQKETFTYEYTLTGACAVAGFVPYYSLTYRDTSAGCWGVSEADEDRLTRAFMIETSSIATVIKCDTLTKFPVGHCRIEVDDRHMDAVQIEENGRYISISIGDHDADMKEKEKQDKTAELNALVDEYGLYSRKIGRHTLEISTFCLVDPICSFVDAPLSNVENTTVAQEVTASDGNQYTIEFHESCINCMGASGMSTVMNDVYERKFDSFGTYFHWTIADSKLQHNLQFTESVDTSDDALLDMIELPMNNVE